MGNFNQPPGGPQQPGGPAGYGAPPPGGYGAPPPGGPSPYAPPMQYAPSTAPGGAAVRGSFGLGFCAGFFGGCIGLILVLTIAKGPETKRGMWVGFGVAFVLSIIMQIVARAH